MIVRVSEDGRISLPLIGEVEVDGLSSSQLEQRLAALLEEKYVLNPQVSVFIKEFASKIVSIIGAVKTPGEYSLLGRQKLMHIISKAGGFMTNAGEQIIIIREQEDGTSASLKIPIDDPYLKGDTTLNIPMESGDVINVPEDKEILIYVFGEVKSPGALSIKKSRIPTLARAIAMAGGFSDRAKKSRVVVKWTDEEGREKQKTYNMKDIMKGKVKDPQLKENDIVYVEETIF